MTQHQQLLRDLAAAKYAEVKALDHGKITGRRLELGMRDASPEKIEVMIIDQFVDVAQRLGVDFFSQTPALALEQFAIMAIIRNEDTAGLIKSVINSFMASYLTPETSERAYQHLVGLEALRAEVSKARASINAPLPALKAYQVGETDIVAAYDPAGAIKVLCDFNGEPCATFELDEVVPVSDALLDNRTAYDSDEKIFVTLEKTLREQMAELNAPAYLHGWE